MKPPHKFKAQDKFGRLTCLKFMHMGKHHRSYWLFLCDCGVEKVIHGSAVSSGNTKSCGCLALEVKAATRLPKDAAMINQIVLQYKRHARDRGIEWKIKRSLVDRIVRSPCDYCGVIGGNIKRNKSHVGFPHNGIDRVDSSKPYKAGNVVPCCGKCNIAKKDTSREEFILWAKRVANHQDAMAMQWGGLVRTTRPETKGTAH